MGKAEEDLHDELLERVARRYFMDGMLQNDIAAAEHLSRPRARLLAEARARGVVQFKIELLERDARCDGAFQAEEYNGHVFLVLDDEGDEKY